MPEEGITPAPARQHQPILNLPPVVKGLCLLNLGVFLLQYFLPQAMTEDVLYALAFVPARYTGAAALGLPALFSPFTHMFIHAGWLHLITNLIALMAFGAGLERALGGRRLLLFYFICGLAGAGLHLLVYPHADVPMIGASGAISGLFGGVLMMMHEAGFMGGGGSYKRLLPVIAVWIGASVFFGFFGMPGVNNPIAWTTHVGGFICGLLIYKPVKNAA